MIRLKKLLWVVAVAGMLALVGMPTFMFVERQPKPPVNTTVEDASQLVEKRKSLAVVVDQKATTTTSLGTTTAVVVDQKVTYKTIPADETVFKKRNVRYVSLVVPDGFSATNNVRRYSGGRKSGGGNGKFDGCVKTNETMHACVASVGLTPSLDFAIKSDYKVVAKWVRRYDIGGNWRTTFLKAVRNCEGESGEWILDAIKKAGLPPEFFYMQHVESTCDNNAKSPKDALGRWQFMHDTATRYGLIYIDDSGNEVDDRKDYKKSTMAAIHYLNDLYKLFGRWDCSVVAYNFGEGGLLDQLLKLKDSGHGVTTCFDLLVSEHVGDGLPYEAKNHLPKVMAFNQVAGKLEDH